MKIFLGFVIFFVGLIGAAIHLGQDASSYYDLVALLIVICGTISVAVTTSPMFRIKIMFNEVSFIFRSLTAQRKEVINTCMDVVRGKPVTLDPLRFEYKIIADGKELIALGFEKEKIEEILTEKSFNYMMDLKSVANWMRNLAKYPPAFGLVGTILGLISLMRGLSEGSDPKQTGLNMAIALVATLYGLVVANLLLNPLGERLRANISEKELLCDIAIKTVLMLKENTNALEAQEMLYGHAGLSFITNSDNLMASLGEVA